MQILVLIVMPLEFVMKKLTCLMIFAVSLFLPAEVMAQPPCTPTCIPCPPGTTDAAGVDAYVDSYFGMYVRDTPREGDTTNSWCWQQYNACIDAAIATTKAQVKAQALTGSIDCDDTATCWRYTDNWHWDAFCQCYIQEVENIQYNKYCSTRPTGCYILGNINYGDSVTQLIRSIGWPLIQSCESDYYDCLYNPNFDPYHCMIFTDFDGDGVGGEESDVDAFYALWENSDPLADINGDEAIDGSDVSAFFEIYEECYGSA